MKFLYVLPILSLASSIVYGEEEERKVEETSVSTEIVDATSTTESTHSTHKYGKFNHTST